MGPASTPRSRSRRHLSPPRTWRRRGRRVGGALAAAALAACLALAGCTSGPAGPTDAAGPAGSAGAGAPAQSRSPSPDRQLAALQAALAAEHAAVYAYGVVGAHVAAPYQPQAVADRDRHRARRDALDAAVRDLGQVPVAAAVAYSAPPLPDQAAAGQLAASVEGRVAGAEDALAAAVPAQAAAARAAAAADRAAAAWWLAPPAPSPSPSHR